MSKKFLSVGNRHGSPSSLRLVSRKSEKRRNETDTSQIKKANKQSNRSKELNDQYFLNRCDQESTERVKKRLDCTSTEVTVDLTTDFQHYRDKKTMGHKSLKVENGLAVSHFDKKLQLLPGNEKEIRESHTNGNSNKSLVDTCASDNVKQEGESQEDSFQELDAKIFNSQEGQSQCDVLWDCRSPEIMKQLKKLRGKHKVEDVKEIISYFPDDTDVKVEPASHFRPLRIWQGPRPVMGSHRNIGGFLKRGPRKQRKSRNRKVVQEMLDFLHSLSKKDQPGQTSEQIGQGQIEISTSSRLEKETASASTNSSRLVDNDDEGLWSDEDLFKDNSFLIEATQNPEKFFHTVENNKQLSISTAGCSVLGSEAGPSVKTCGNAPVNSLVISKAHSLKPISSGSKSEHEISSSSCLSDSSCSDSMIIPSSLAKPVQPKPNMFCQASKGPLIKDSFPTRKTVQNTYSSHITSYGAKFSNSVKSFAAKQSNNSERNQHQNAHRTQQNGAASSQQASKAVWKKHNSFQSQCGTKSGFPPAIKDQSTSSTSAASVTNDVTSRINGSSASSAMKDRANHGNNSSFRKSLSFDSLQAPSPNGRDGSSAQRDGKREQELSFDTSLPDEVLLLLAEPDEILDSQEVIAASEKHCSTATNVIQTKNASNLHLERSSCNTGSIDSLKSMGLKASTSSGADSFCKDSSGEKKKPEIKNGLFSPIKAVDSLHSSVIRSPVQTFFKRTFGLKSKEGGGFGPKASTPVKCARKDDEKAALGVKGLSQTSGQTGSSSDSFLESAFDDSFMNDGHLFESQILPLLEQAESQLETATSDAVLAESKAQRQYRAHDAEDVRTSTKCVSMHQPDKAATMAAHSNKSTTSKAAQANKTVFTFVPSKKVGTMTAQSKQRAASVPQPNKYAPDLSRYPQSHFTATLISSNKTVPTLERFAPIHSSMQPDTTNALSANTKPSGQRIMTKHYPPKREREQHASLQACASKQVKQPGSSHFQCSPEEIALKRQAAIERRSLRLSQSGKT